MATIQELLDLTKEAQERRDALTQLAQTQTQGPFLNQGQSQATALTGRGTPEQQRAATAMFTRGLSRQPGESRIAALGSGFEKGMQLRDELKAGKRQEALQGGEQAVKSAEGAVKDRASIYALEQEAEKLKRQRGKTGTVSFGGQVWQTDANGQLVRPLGATEGQMGRSDDERVRQEKAKMAKEEAEADKMAKVTSAADVGVAIAEDIADIREGITGWTEGMTGKVGSVVSGTDAFDQQLLIDGLKAKLGLGKLKELRDAAKSGASGMGNLTEKELDRLESAIAKLDIGGSKGAQERALKDIERYYMPAINAYANVFGIDKLTGQKVLTYNPETGAFE